MKINVAKIKHKFTKKTGIQNDANNALVQRWVQETSKRYTFHESILRGFLEPADSPVFWFSVDALMDATERSAPDKEIKQ